MINLFDQQNRQYTTQELLKSQCELYKAHQEMEKDFSEPNTIYEKLSFSLEYFNMHFYHTYIHFDIAIHETLKKELLELQKEKDKICTMLIKIQESQIISAHICYEAKNREAYKEINKRMTERIKKEIFENNFFQNNPKVINFIIQYFALKNGYYFKSNQATMQLAPCNYVRIP
ncbi:hypothetical protein AB837_00432 [bacterium AB1]|nr:hypothetical protein AB837_00432 [bacterium AB1]